MRFQQILLCICNTSVTILRLFKYFIHSAIYHGIGKTQRLQNHSIYLDKHGNDLTLLFRVPEHSQQQISSSFAILSQLCSDLDQFLEASRCASKPLTATKFERHHLCDLVVTDSSTFSFPAVSSLKMLYGTFFCLIQIVRICLTRVQSDVLKRYFYRPSNQKRILLRRFLCEVSDHFNSAPSFGDTINIAPS